MIAGIFHQGSGLGNQLFRYVATRVLAEDKGYKWGMQFSDNFKGSSFMKIELPVAESGSYKTWIEKKVIENDIDIRGYDPEINFVKDGTVIDGEFQDPRYFEHRLGDVKKWLKTTPLEVPDELCVIGFRGGEYSVFKDLFLPKEYFEKAIARMRGINSNMRFEVHTDDPIWARQYFPDFNIVADVGLNWRSVRYAKHSIISNSSFYILPRLLKHFEDKHYIGKRGAITIAPRYWARHNIKVWALPQNYYKQFTYIHAEDSD